MGLLHGIMAACQEIENQDFKEETEISIDEEWSTIHKYDGAHYQVQLDFKWDTACHEKHRTILHFSLRHHDNAKIALMKEAFDRRLGFDCMAEEKLVEVKIHIPGEFFARARCENMVIGIITINEIDTSDEELPKDNIGKVMKF